MAYTMQDLIDRVKGDLHDTRATRRWSDATIMDYGNDGAIEIMMVRPDSTSEEVDFTLRTGPRQELHSTSYRLLDVMHNGTKNVPGTAVRQVSLEELDSYTPHWRKATAVREILEYAYDENDARGFYVVPPSTGTYSTAVLLVSQYPIPATQTTDEIPVREEFFTALQYYVCWRCLNQDFEYSDSNRAEVFYQKFLTALGMKNSGDNQAFPATGQVPDRTK